MTDTNRIQLVAMGGEHSGKGTLMAFIAHMLKEHGIETTVQMADTHNKPKLELSTEELVARLKKSTIVLTEQTTMKPLR